MHSSFHSYSQKTPAFTVPYHVVWRRGWRIILSILIPRRWQLSQCSTMSFGDVVDAFFFPFLFPQDTSFHCAVLSRLATWLMHSSFHSYSQNTPAFTVQYQVVWRCGWCILLSILIPRRRQLSQCRTMSFGDAVGAFFPFLFPEDDSFHSAVPCRLVTWLMHSSTLCHHTDTRVGHTNVWMSLPHRPTIWRSIGTDAVQQISPTGLRLWLPPCHWKTLQCYDSTHRRASPALVIVYSSPCCSSRHTYICEFP